MKKIQDVLVYICSNYPYKNELSKARVTKMVYLADWKSAMDQGKQITGIEWFFHQYGPYVSDVVEAAYKSPYLTVESTANVFGYPKDLIKITKQTESYDSLSDKDKEILDYVINKTEDLNWDEFMRLVYSTYPIAQEKRYRYLNLVKFAEEYKATA